MSVNRVFLIGNLGRDPEMRATAGGTSVCNLNVATTDRRKKGDGYEDHTEWHRVTSFGKTAEQCGKFLSKGRQVYVEGRLQTREWQDKDGNKRWTTEIVADRVQFLGGGSGGGAQCESRPAASRDTGGGYGGDYGAGGIDEDDVPFASRGARDVA